MTASNTPIGDPVLTASLQAEGMVFRDQARIPEFNLPEEPELLQTRLDELRASRLPVEERLPELERIFFRTKTAVEKRLPVLAASSFPIHRKNRQLVRSLHRLLSSLVDDQLILLKEVEAREPRNILLPTELILWRTLQLLAWHLLISDLAAAPPSVGVWQQLHHTYAQALEQDVAQKIPKGASISLQHLYYAAVLLGCAQPASFSSREIGFVADYLESFADQTDPGNDTTPESPAAFWIDTTRDAPAIACSRKPPPPDTIIHYFCCDRIAELLRNQLDSLEQGMQPSQIGLPEFAGTPPGRGVMRRLISHWGEPGKRRFPRRRQNYRAALCTGLGNLWQMFHAKESLPVDTSSWMIINESPDGYAVMHVSGKTGPITVGDVTAIRTETGDNWQICLVRWALSENQEHFELGLQIIATRAIPAILAAPATASTPEPLSVLVLPEIPSLRAAEMLVVPTGTLDNQTRNLILMLEKENLEIREVRSTGLNEQNGQIEVFTIEPESPPA